MKRFFLIVFFLFPVANVYAEADISVSYSYYSNINRSVDSRLSDSIISLDMAYKYKGDDEDRLEPQLFINLYGARYVKYEELSYAELSLSPSVIYHLSANVSAMAAVNFAGRAVNDQQQNALIGGLALSLSENISDELTLSQYYYFKKTFADNDLYSSNSHTLGLSLDYELFSNSFISPVYEFSYTDSFRTSKISETTTSNSRKGRHRWWVSSGNERIFKEKVSSNLFGVGIYHKFSESFSADARYSVEYVNGHSGKSVSKKASLGITYNF